MKKIVQQISNAITKNRSASGRPLRRHKRQRLFKRPQHDIDMLLDRRLRHGGLIERQLDGSKQRIRQVGP
jgi:hypothetical protein